MKYKVELEATVEAESAETAEDMMFGALAGCADDIGTKVVPAKEWYVDVQVTATCTFAVKVNAESAEDAENKAYELVEDEARYGDGIPGVLEMADNDNYELVDLDIAVTDAAPEEDEEDAEPAQPDTATESPAA
jgi:hypothetical protein